MAPQLSPAPKLSPGARRLCLKRRRPQANGTPPPSGAGTSTPRVPARSGAVTAAPGHTPFCGFPASAVVALAPTPGHTPFCGFPALAAVAATPPPGHPPFCGYPALAAVAATATPEGPDP
ncbi:hypothetical protein PCASD_02861 [Puccinia coronata f. sp. avenae]|uniref:Uncharacterized protein n=1 Tax=Puccinia coronata f. sp. avenae TaxID=200324 RepID=A0A2N5VEF9_9BASI|nr:hypothetical protein PCASD_02861 [Puccinia coronata f. sp. avenae]